MHGGYPGVDLRGAILAGADLTDVDLSSADLSPLEANLWLAHPRDASLMPDHEFWYRTDLRGANLTRAYLPFAKLRGVIFGRFDGNDTVVADANFAVTDVYGVLFDVRDGSLPRISAMAVAENLSRLYFSNNRHSLVSLRDEFRKAGDRAAERQVTYAIKHSELQLSGPVEAFFTWLFFELPSAWGMYPARPLKIIAGLILLFSIPYAFALREREEAGIWAVWLDDRVHKTEKPEPPIRVTEQFLFRSGEREAGRFTRWFCVGLVSLYFSLISAAQIGWRDLNIGNWITRMQPREYTLRATGWVRVISGCQSLISVYLLALWVLTYFGRPFD